jgi:hypothetical protein
LICVRLEVFGAACIFALADTSLVASGVDNVSGSVLFLDPVVDFKARILPRLPAPIFGPSQSRRSQGVGQHDIRQILMHVILIAMMLLQFSFAPARHRVIYQ